MPAPLEPTRDIEPVTRPSDSTRDATPSTDPGRTGPYIPRAAGPDFHLPNYEIVRELGRGGMGVVYLARQVLLNREVALKVVRGGDSKELIRFLAEAVAVAAVKHPHVVAVHEYGEHDGRPFIVMEYLPGSSLAGRLAKERRLEPKAAAQLVERIARGVAAAHALQIVHRDLKPGNVLLDESGEPKVSDFGLAKRAAGNDLTATEAVMGTPSYMAPEQAAGKAKFVGPEADVYALGVILYECLTGTVPFKGDDTWTVLRRVIAETPLPPRKHVPGIPRDLETIALKCLEKEPTRRYPSADLLADDLGRYLAGQPISARRVGRVEQAVLWAKRNPTLTAAVGFAALAIALGGAAGGAGWLWMKAEDARSTADSLRSAAEIDKSAAVTAKGEAERTRDLFDQLKDRRNVDLAYRAYAENNVLKSLRLLAATTPARRDWEWRYVAKLCRSEDQLIRADGYTHSIGLTPDGTKLFAALDEKPPKIFDFQTGAERLAYRGHANGSYRGTLFPDGKRAATGDRAGHVHIWDTTTGQTLHRLQLAENKRVSFIAVSPDGERIAAGDEASNIAVWAAATGLPIRRFALEAGYSHGLCFSPDGGTLYASGQSYLQALDLKTGKPSAPPPRVERILWAVVLTPDGKRLLTSDEAGKVAAWEPDTLKPIGEFDAHTERIWEMRYSPNGKQVLTCSLDQTVRIWDARTWPWKPLRTFRGHTNDVMDGLWLPDGRVATCGDQTIRIWNTRRDQEARVLPAGSPVRDLAFAPNGQYVAAATYQGLVAWDAATGKKTGTWARDMAFGSIRFAPDSSAVVGGGADGHVHVWPLAGGASRHWPAHAMPVMALAIAGGRLATGGADGSLALWDFAAGTKLWSIPDAHKGLTMGVAISPDGTRIVSCGQDAKIRFWDAATGSPAGELRGHTGPVARVVFSPDGTRLASGSHDATMRLWDPAAMKPLEKTKAHVHYLDGLAYSPTGTRIADACGDKTVVLYDAKTGEELFTLRGHTDWVTGAAFSPDGDRLATGSLDGTLRIWDAPRSATVEIPPEADESTQLE